MKKFKNEKLNKLKDLIKINASLRKYQRLTRKLKHDKLHDETLFEIKQLMKLHKLPKLSSYNIRLHYIAYGLLRGKEYKQIETNCKQENELSAWDWKLINDIVDKHCEEKQDEKNVSLGA